MHRLKMRFSVRVKFSQPIKAIDAQFWLGFWSEESMLENLTGLAAKGGKIYKSKMPLKYIEKWRDYFQKRCELSV